MNSLTVPSSARLRITGSRPIAVLSNIGTTIDGELDVSARGDTAGPGGGNGGRTRTTPGDGLHPDGTTPGGRAGGVTCGGGGGGGNLFVGGAGACHPAPSGAPGLTIGGCLRADISNALGGSGGGRGSHTGDGTTWIAGSGGGGGGYLYLFSPASIHVNGTLAARGEIGRPAGVPAWTNGCAGGGGGGAGGTVVLHAAEVAIDGRVELGGGAGGAGSALHSGVSADADGGLPNPPEHTAAGECVEVLTAGGVYVGGGGGGGHGQLFVRTCPGGLTGSTLPAHACEPETY